MAALARAKQMNEGLGDDAEDTAIAVFTRAKNSAGRSEEEKAWVALDVLVNPYKYAHVTEAEAEEMKFDEAYKVKPGVHREDVKRILALPRSLNLALPFLFSEEEVEMHRLLLKYTYGRGEEYYVRLDGESQNKKATTRSTTSAAAAGR